LERAGGGAATVDVPARGLEVAVAEVGGDGRDAAAAVRDAGTAGLAEDVGAAPGHAGLPEDGAEPRDDVVVKKWTYTRVLISKNP